MTRFAAVIEHTARRIDALRAELADHERERERLLVDMTAIDRDRRHQADRTSVRAHELYADFCAVSWAQRDRLQRQVIALARSSERLRAEMLALHQRRRALERLVERDREAATLRAAKRTERELLELAARAEVAP